MKFFYGLAILVLIAAFVGAVPFEDDAVPEIAAVNPSEQKVAEKKPEPTGALAVVAGAIQKILNDKNIAEHIENVKNLNNVDQLVTYVESMDPVLKHLEKLRAKHPIFGQVIHSYKDYRAVILGQIRVFLAPFNILIGLMGRLIGFFG